MAGPGKEPEEGGGEGMPTIPPSTFSALAPAAMSALASEGRMPRGSRVSEAPFPGEKRARAAGFQDAQAQGPRGHVSGSGTPQLPANPGASRRRELLSAERVRRVQDRDLSVQGFGFRELGYRV